MSRDAIMSIALAAGLAASGVWAQSPTMQDKDESRDEASQTKGDDGQGGVSTRATSASANVGAMDRRFMEEAARSGMAEVALGQLAQQRAESAEVKSFAKTMVDEHSRANEELKSLAARKGVTLPQDVAPQHKSEQDRLARLSGAEFDAAYVKAMVKEHEKDVDSFRRQSTSGQDPDTKEWAGKTLPKLQSHLQHAQTLDDEVGDRKRGPAGQEGGS